MARGKEPRQPRPRQSYEELRAGVEAATKQRSEEFLNSVRGLGLPRHGACREGFMPSNLHSMLHGLGDYGAHSTYTARCNCPNCHERFVTAPEWRERVWSPDHGL